MRLTLPSSTSVSLGSTSSEAPAFDSSTPAKRRKQSRRAQRRRTTRAGLRLELLEARQLMVGDVTGTVFIDTNANGVDDPGEPGLSGWTVYLDANGDHKRSVGETFTVSDSKGKFAMIGVTAGTRTLQSKCKRA